MKRALQFDGLKAYVAIACLGAMVLTGCGPTNDPADGTDDGAEAAAVETETDEGSSSEDAGGDGFSLTPDNTKIQFVGNHTGDDPKPRTCTFNGFDGKLEIVDGQLAGLNITIDTNSIETEFEKLTTHLKAADFFDVKRHASAAFRSTSVKALDSGEVEISGDLTLLGETKPITFPAQFSAEGPSLTAEFEIDRTLWGMDYDPSKVEKMVELSVTVGM